MLRVRKATVMRLVLFILFSAVLFTCGDETERDYTISVSPSLAALQYDGTESIELSVQVYDDSGQPADSGDRVTVEARDREGHATGRLGSDGSAQEDLYLNSSGAASTTFTCNVTTDQAATIRTGEAFWVALIFEHANGQRGTASINCMLVYTGDWRIVTVAADVVEILPEGGTADVTVTAHQSEDTDGDGLPDAWGPVPAGTQFRFSTIGPCGFGTGGAATERVTGASGSGMATTTVVSQDTEGGCVISVTFDEDNRCITPEDVTQTNYCVGSTTVSVDRDTPLEPRLVLVAIPESVPADGVSTISITASVTEAGAVALAFVEVDFTTTGGTLISDDSSGSELSVLTDSTGQVTITLQASLTPGTVDVRAEAGHGASELSHTLNISFVDVGPVEVVGETAPTLGVQDSGRDYTAVVCFDIKDTDDEPFPDGYDVRFTGTDVSSEQAVVEPGPVLTDDGRACTNVIAGTTAGNITVKACVEVGESTRCGYSWPIGVVGGRPYRGGMSLSCSPVNLGALRWRDEGASEITLPPSGRPCTECSVQLSDQNGNPVGVFDDINVTFLAESGRFPSGQQATPDSNGHASVTWCADGPMPVDVPPLAGEPSWEEELTHITRNPRDGLVTIIAYVNGEEEFTDRNGNGQWDRGEPGDIEEHFWDQPEPFVDANDNNEFDPEIDTDFFDVDGGTPNVWDSGNCTWDGGANTTAIWVQTRVLLTGPPAFDERGFFDGVSPGAPNELELDSDYPSEQRLSHWYEQGQGNVFQPPSVLDNCDIDDPSFGQDEYCYDLPISGSFTLFFNARDMFGNPLNESVEDVVPEFSPAECNSEFSVTALTMSPPADQLPFSFSTVSQEPGGFVEECVASGVDNDRANGYAGRITSFPTISGSYQRFTINYNGGATVNCQMRMIYDTYKSCNSCGDPTLDLRGDWPYFIMVPQ